jgi:hypothetical protein
MRGFVAILEAFLAIVLIYIVFTQVQISIPARYSDTSNIERLHRYAHDIAFSVCGNLKDKRELIGDTLTFDLANNLPIDVCYHIFAYKNSSNTHLLDQLIYDYSSVASTAGQAELFYDEFANLDNWTGDIGGTGWRVNTTLYENGSNSAYKSNYTIDSMSHSRSTSGYSDIRISFWTFNTLRDATPAPGEYMNVSWFNGTQWNLLYSNYNDPIWTYYEYSLPDGASNNPNFAVRVACYCWHNPPEIDYSGRHEKCNIDSFRILGSAINLCDVSTTSATSSCLLAGGPNATQVNVSNCLYSGGNCLSLVDKSDDSRVNLNANQYFSVAFNSSAGSIVEFYLEGLHNQSGMTYLYANNGNQIAGYNFSASDEVHGFDLTDLLSVSNGMYNVTIKAFVNASFDNAYMVVSNNIYSPRRVVVQTWNIGG